MPTSRKSAVRRPHGSPHGAYAECILRLYVNDLTPRSRLAIANARELCAHASSGQVDLKIIDICHQPQVAKAEQIVALPTLLRKWPLPEKRIIGDLSNTERVLVGLDIRPHA